MAYFVDASPAEGRPGDVHTTQKNDLGAVRTASDGSVYIYLKGATSTLAHEVVSYQPGVFTIVRLATGVKGAVAITSGAIDAATKYGWCMIVGTDVVTVRTAVTSNTALFIGGVTGFVDVAGVKGDQILNLHCRNAAAAVGSAVLQINRANVGHSNESTG